VAKHRAERPPRVRARYGRIAAATLSLVVTAVALLGGVGIIPIQAGDRAAADGGDLSRSSGAPADTTGPDESDGSADASAGEVTGLGPPRTSEPPARQTERKRPANAVPAGTGTGRRVVFSEADQRVWLVNAENRVVSTYLVSGSLTDNLKPGRYAVYSRSRWAVGIDDSGVMQYFVRFTRGDNAAIGFHSIPTKLGKPLQTVAQLGTPQSHGCIRQEMKDAERMWEFAPVGTRVVVV
jgi:hypothetical protein